MGRLWAGYGPVMGRPWAAAPLSADEESEIDAVLAGYPAASREYGHGEPPPRN